ncbi:MAG: hypothetical protein ACYC9S_05410 [Leptospirales bacterium]
MDASEEKQVLEKIPVNGNAFIKKALPGRLESTGFPERQRTDPGKPACTT